STHTSRSTAGSASTRSTSLSPAWPWWWAPNCSVLCSSAPTITTLTTPGRYPSTSGRTTSMFDFVLPPALVMIAGGFLIALVRQSTLRALIALATPLITLLAIWQVGDGVQLTASFLGYEAQLVEGSSRRRLFATGCALMGFGGVLCAFRRSSRWELSSDLSYAAVASRASLTRQCVHM